MVVGIFLGKNPIVKKREFVWELETRYIFEPRKQGRNRIVGSRHLPHHQLREHSIIKQNNNLKID